MFNKLFTRILDSSIWLEPTDTRIVWITLLAAMDEDGYAHFSALENLASRARVTLEETKKAVECLLAPDANSGDPDNDGRRIERVPGGFLILNAAKHRDIMNRVIDREKTRVRVADWRAKNPDKSGKKIWAVQPPEKPSLATQNGPFSVEELLKNCGTVYKRPESQRPSYAEECAAAEVVRRDNWEREMDEVLALKARMDQKGEGKFFPNSLASLLQNWSPTLDKARNYNAKNKGPNLG